MCFLGMYIFALENILYLFKSTFHVKFATFNMVVRLRDKNNATENPDCTDSVPYQQLINLEDGSLKKVTGFSLFLYQFWALLFKKVILLIRKSKVFLLYCVSMKKLLCEIIGL